MPPPAPLPRYVYKIIQAAPPDPIPDEYPLSELDQADGFVHLSAAWQIPATAGLFFADRAELWILKLRLAGLAADTTWDDSTDAGNDGGRPHLYGNFGAADVEGARNFVRPEGRSWAWVFLDQAEWLE